MESEMHKFIKDDLIYKLEYKLESNNITYKDISDAGDSSLLLELIIQDQIIYFRTYEFVLKLQGIINTVELCIYKDINNRPHKQHQFIYIEFDRTMYSDEFIINSICDSAININLPHIEEETE